jgi:carboxymethylenebutenolidase
MKHTGWIALFACTLVWSVGCKNGEGVPDEAQQTASAQEAADQEAKEDEMAKDDEKEGITSKMAEEHQDDEPTASPLTEMEPAQPVVGQAVSYGTVDGQEVTGYVAEPENASGPLPSLIVIHEWWGLNDNIRKMARFLAGEGYRALAVDLYGDKVAETPDKAQTYMGAAMKNKEAVKANLKEAYRYLEEDREAPKVGVIGWCFGGGWSLQTALMYPEQIDATVIYYGELVTDREALKTLQMPMVGFFGSEDNAIPPSKVRTFESTLKDLGKNAEMYIYEGANHAFANPSGKRYDPKAAADAWKKTTAFLAKHLK